MFTVDNRVDRCFHRKRGFTLIELLVVIAIIAILAAVLFPVFSRARESARRSSCESNMKQINLGIIQYTQDADEKMPPMWYYVGLNAFCWPVLIQPYLKSTNLFLCPSATEVGNTIGTSGQFVPYGMNTNFDPNNVGAGSNFALSSLTRPSELLMIVENCTPANSGYYASYYNETNSPWLTNVTTPTQIHFSGANVGYADGHVKFQTQAYLTNVPPSVTAATWTLWQTAVP